jgi:hypothetical protein
MSTPNDQMACCNDGQLTCGQHGTPAECCKAGPQAAQFTTVNKIPAPLPPLLIVQTFGSDSIAALVSWHQPPRKDTWSRPPGSKHPTYLQLSTFRI